MEDNTKKKGNNKNKKKNQKKKKKYKEGNSNNGVTQNKIENIIRNNNLSQNLQYVNEYIEKDDDLISTKLNLSDKIKFVNDIFESLVKEESNIKIDNNDKKLIENFYLYYHCIIIPMKNQKK